MTKQLENYLNHYNYVVGEPCGENVQAACAEIKASGGELPDNVYFCGKENKYYEIKSSDEITQLLLIENARTNDKLEQLVSELEGEHAQQARMRKDVKSIKSVALFFLIISIIGFAVMFLNIASIARILH